MNPPRDAAAPAPIPPAERAVSIDILRGFALFGILLVNMLDFAGPTFRAVPMSLWQAPLDRATEWFVRVFAEGAFAPIFAGLFGVGVALQLRRSGTKRLPVMGRRYLWLLVIGLAHAMLLWRGDILTDYALAGLVLLVLALLPTRTLLRLAGILFAISVALSLPGLFSNAEPFGARPERVAELISRYGSGGYLELLRARLPEVLDGLAAYPIYTFPLVMWLFLGGVLLGRSGVLERPTEHRSRLVALLLVVLPAAVVFRALFGFLLLDWGVAERQFFTLNFAGPLLAASYTFGLALLLADPAWRWRLAPLAAVGRMALSNYLGQTLIAVLLFHGYGFGLYGRVGPAWGLAATVAVFALQVALSVWWLRRFRFGPAEWAWRSLSYRRAQPWRR